MAVHDDERARRGVCVKECLHRCFAKAPASAERSQKIRIIMATPANEVDIPRLHRWLIAGRMSQSRGMRRRPKVIEQFVLSRSILSSRSGRP
jgi:hypothetical protein